MPITGFAARYCDHYVRLYVWETSLSQLIERTGRLLCPLLAAFLCPVALGAKLAVDEPARDFALKSSAGRNVRLSEYRGDVVLLNFWTRSCSRCREQLDRLDELYRAHRDDGFVVLSVAMTDDPHHIEEIIAGLKLGFQVLYDVRKVAARLYEPSSVPLSVLIDPHGNIRYVHEKYKRGDEAIYRDQVMALLAESGTVTSEVIQ